MSRTLTTAALLVAASALGTGAASADSGATGAAAGSPGLLSGNLLQAPVHLPVNLCGNSIDVVGLLNPASGTCANATHPATPPAPVSGHTPCPPRHHRHHHCPCPTPSSTSSQSSPTESQSAPTQAQSQVQSSGTAAPAASLAETGADSGTLGLEGATAIALVGAGALVARRGRRRS